MPHPDLSRFDAVLSPAQRDLLVEIVAALKAKGIAAELRGEVAANVYAVLDGQQPPAPGNTTATLGVTVSRDDRKAAQMVAEALQTVGERHPELTVGSSYYEGKPLGQADYPEGETSLLTVLPDGKHVGILLEDAHYYPAGGREEEPIAGLPLPLVDRYTAQLSVELQREGREEYARLHGLVADPRSRSAKAGIRPPFYRENWRTMFEHLRDSRPPRDLDLAVSGVVTPQDSASLAGNRLGEILAEQTTRYGGHVWLGGHQETQLLPPFLASAGGTNSSLYVPDPQSLAPTTESPEDSQPSAEATGSLSPGRRRARPVRGADPFGPPGGKRTGGGVPGGPA